MNDLMLSLVTAGFALWCAMDDADAIAEGRKIRHGLQWTLRAAVVFGACWLLVPAERAIVLHGRWPENIYAFCRIVLLAVPFAFLFSGVFRLCLNRLRGLDVRYVAPWSNVYDRMLYSIAGDGWYHKDCVWPSIARAYHNGYKYDGVIMWGVRDRVHRAGTIAYIFEAVAYGVGLYAF